MGIERARITEFSANFFYGIAGVVNISQSQMARR
jgi:hypothetical protein